MDRRRTLVPILILSVGVLVLAVLWFTRAKVESGESAVAAPLVRVVTVEPGTVRLVVHANGTVEPRVETRLVSQVSGEIVWVSPAMLPGGFFEPGEVLVRIDPVDYDADIAAARAVLDRAESALANSKRERERQRKLSERSAASQSRLDEAENAYRAADATVREARVHLERAQRDRARTELHAAYAGRVREEQVDIGQFVRRGDVLAELYAIEYAEVPLPVPDRELGFLPLHHPYRDLSDGSLLAEPAVTLRAEFAGVLQEWRGTIVRTEATIDPRSRTVTVVARVNDPYGREPGAPDLPLPVGLFVEAEIEGREVENAVLLPSTALREHDTVYVVDAEERLRFRTVDVLRVQRDEIVIASGLAAGERVCVSSLRGAVDGMLVRATGETARAQVEAATP